MDQYTFNNDKPVMNVAKTERILSIVAGAWMVFRMLKKRNLGLLNGAGAAFLLYRGLSGHCPAREAINKYTNKLKEEADFPLDPIEDPAIVDKIVTP